MEKQQTGQFYSDLIRQDLELSQLLMKKECFETVPEDWHVVITDIQSSTKAVREGQQQLVNLIASGSIIAAINIARDAATSVPFFFGGDGATLLVPPILLEPIMTALMEHRGKKPSKLSITT